MSSLSIEWNDDDHLVVGGALVHCTAFASPHADVLQLSKVRNHAESFIDRVDDFRGGAVLEIGIAGGGSVALIAGAIGPRKLVALDLDPNRVAPLDRFIRENDLAEVVRPFYGVDQADRPRLEEIVEAEFDGPVDLIIDDGSHLYGPTRESFECLFPRLAEGGVYMVEDWRWEHLVANAVAASSVNGAGPEPLESIAESSRTFVEAAIRRGKREGDPFRDQVQWVLAFLEGANAETRVNESDAGDVDPQADSEPWTPLTSLLSRILLLRASTTDVIRDIHVDTNWFSVRRGSTPAPDGGFDLDATVLDCFGQLEHGS